MVFEGYLELGGGEVLNSARAVGYTETAPCPVAWLQCPPCDGVRDVLGDDAYTYETIFDAPWYDEEDETTHRFLGAHALSIEGLPDSTREADVAEGVLDGGVVGRVRNATRRMRVRAILTGLGEDALDSGFAWLSSALTPGKCSTHADACGAADMQVFTACPPERADITMPEVVWNDPVTNLATNPSFETTAAVTTVRTNLATNPSFEQATAATVEVRRNLALTPSIYPSSGPVAGWNISSRWAGGGTWANTVANGVAVTGPTGTGITTAQRKTWTAVSANGPDDFAFSLNHAARVPVVAGETYTISYYIKPSWNLGTNPPENNIHINAHNVATGGTAVQDSKGPRLPVPAANVWTRLDRTYTVPAGATFLEVYHEFYSDKSSSSFWPIIGSTMDATGLLVEKAAAPVGTFFEGRTLPAGDFTHAWTGTVDATPSVQYAIAVPSMNFHPSNGDKAYSSTAWAASGTKSATLVMGGSGNGDTFIELPAAWVGPATPGRTVTFLARARLTAPLTGVTHGTPGRVRSFMLGLTAGGEAGGGQFPNVAGVHEMRWTYTFPAGSTGVTLFRIYAGHQWGQVWWDDLLIVDGTYTGPYFDGSTPAKVRRNLVLNPAFANLTGLQGTTFGAGGNGTTALVAGAGRDGQQAWRKTWTTAPSDLSAYHDFGGKPGNPTAGQGAGTPVDGPRLYTASIWFRSSMAGNYRYTSVECDAAGGSQFILGGPSTPVAANTWTRLYYTDIAKPTTRFQRATIQQASGTPPVVGTTWDVSQHLVEYDVSVPGVYIDGTTPVAPYAAAWEGTPDASPSYLYDADFIYQWSSTAHNSASAQRGTSVAGQTGGLAAISSTEWSSNRTRSIRVPGVGPDGNTYASPVVALTIGKTYTVSATIRLTGPQGGTLHSRARKIMLREGTGGTDRFTEAAPNAAGVTRLTGTFTVVGAGNGIYLYNGSTTTDAWWDDLLVVEGEYPGAYFDGSLPDSTPEELATVGQTVADYEWTGTPDASTSTYKTGQVVAVPDPVAYEAAVEKLVRNLHTVTCVSGPIVEQKLHRGDTWGYIVEFVLVAAVPWMFGVTKPVALTPSTPIVVQDVPFNLVPYPSAELESGTVVATTNFVTNPSIEVDTTGWSVIPSAAITAPQLALSRSQELWSVPAVGGSSAKVLATLTGSGTNSYFGVQQIVQLPGITPTTRYSVNLWSSASVESGTAVLGEIVFHAWWEDAAGNSLRDDTFARLPASGGAASMRSLLPPAGTTRVRFGVAVEVASFSAGAKIRLYTDAAAVTVP